MGLAFCRLHQPNVCVMPRTRSQRAQGALHKSRFRPGRSGACEARLFRFTGQANGGDEPSTKLVAACDIHEALIYVRKSDAELDILGVEFVALIEMLSGSPLD